MISRALQWYLTNTLLAILQTCTILYARLNWGWGGTGAVPHRMKCLKCCTETWKIEHATNHVTPVAGPTVPRENDRLGAIPASSYNPYPPVNIDMEHPPWKIHVLRKPCFVFPYPIVKCYADLKIVICTGDLIFQPHSRGSMSFHWGMFLKKKHWRGHPPFSSQRWNVAPLSCCATGGLQTAQRLQARNQKLGQWIFETGIRGCQQKETLGVQTCQTNPENWVLEVACSMKQPGRLCLQTEICAHHQLYILSTCCARVIR